MKRTLLLTLLITAACMATGLYVLADASGCPEQEFGDLSGYNLDYISVDPISGLHLRLPGSINAVVGMTTTFIGKVCDEDAMAGTQTLRLVRGDTNQEIAIDPNTWTYELKVLYASPGTKFIPLALNDGLQERRGTKIVYVRENRAPILY